MPTRREPHHPYSCHIKDTEPCLFVPWPRLLRRPAVLPHIEKRRPCVLDARLHVARANLQQLLLPQSVVHHEAGDAPGGEDPRGYTTLLLRLHLAVATAREDEKDAAASAQRSATDSSSTPSRSDCRSSIQSTRPSRTTRRSYKRHGRELFVRGDLDLDEGERGRRILHSWYGVRRAIKFFNLLHRAIWPHGVVLR